MPVGTMMSIIRRLIDIHESLYEIALKKTEAIKTGDVEAVGHFSGLEQPLIEQLQVAEGERAAVAEEDVRKAGGDAKAPTFSEWEASAVSADKRTEWQALYKELAHCVFALKQANRLNQDLLRQSLQWVRLNMGLLRPQAKTANYGNPKGGQTSSSPFSGRIDSRA